MIQSAANWLSLSQKHVNYLHDFFPGWAVYMPVERKTERKKQKESLNAVDLKNTYIFAFFVQQKVKIPFLHNAINV